MRIRMKIGSRALPLHWAADLLMLLGIAGLLLFAWSLLDGTYYQYAQRPQFEKQSASPKVVGASTGIPTTIALPETRPQPDAPFHLLPNPTKLFKPDPLLIG
jgi:hypothetical protein